MITLYDLIQKKYITYNIDNFADWEVKITLWNTSISNHILIYAHLYPRKECHEIISMMWFLLKSIYPDILIDLFVPYMPYMRQDHPRLGESPSLQYLAAQIQFRWIQELYTIHTHTNLQKFFTIKIHTFDHISCIHNYIQNAYLEQPILIWPDDWSTWLLQSLHDTYGYQIVIWSKTRIQDNQVQDISFKSVNISNQHCIIIDDICDTGNTLAKTASYLYQYGAKQVDVWCTHAVCSLWYDDILNKAGIKKFITTDTIPKKYTNDFVSHEIYSIVDKYFELLSLSSCFI